MTTGTITPFDSSGNNVTSLTVAHSNNGDYLVVGLTRRAGSRTQPTITYGGAAMQNIGYLTPSNDIQMEYSLWGLINPVSGTNNLVISATLGGMIGGCVSLVGAEQAHPAVGARATGFGSDTTPTVTLNSVAIGDIIIDAGGFRNNSVPSGRGANQDLNWSTSTSSNGMSGWSSRKTGVSGTTTMTWTLSATQFWGLTAAYFKPAATGPTPVVDVSWASMETPIGASTPYVDVSWVALGIPKPTALPGIEIAWVGFEAPVDAPQEPVGTLQEQVGTVPI